MRASVLALLLLSCHAGPRTAPPGPSFDTSCKTDNDCMPAPECCPVPCTSDVINVKEADRARAALHCDSGQQCMSAGGCRTFRYLCVVNQCKLVFYDEPAYRERPTPQ